MTSTVWQQKSKRNYLDEGDLAPAGILDDVDSPAEDDTPGAEDIDDQMLKMFPAYAGAPGTVPQPSAPPSVSTVNGGVDPSLVQSQGPADAGPSSPSLAIDPGYSDALEAMKTLIGQRPIEFEPKWWQRVAAGVAGGLGGWSNAASRTKRPIDIAAAQENILHPGYQTKLAEWQSRVAPAEALAQIAAQRQSATLNAAQMQSKAQLERAQAEAALEHGQYWTHRAQMEQNRFKIGPKGQVVDTLTGEVKTGAPTLQDRYDEAIALGFEPSEARIYAANPSQYGRPTPKATPPKNMNAADVLLHPEDFDKATVSEAKRQFALEHKEPRDPNAPKPMTPALKSEIEARKNSRLNTAQARAADRVSKGGEDRATVQADLERDKQEIQNQYESEIAAVTGQNPGHFDYRLDAGRVQPKVKTVTPAVQSALKSVGPGIHTLSDGSTWMKHPDGSITGQ